MTEVLFYHLTEKRLEDALPPLLERSLARGWRVAVEVPDLEAMERLDQHLWTYQEESFLAHGTDSAPLAEAQPVLLTASGGNANRADIRFLTGGASAAAAEEYQRIVYLFDGLDPGQVEHARGEWKRLKTAGHQLTYWQQTADGRWEKKA